VDLVPRRNFTLDGLELRARKLKKDGMVWSWLREPEEDPTRWLHVQVDPYWRPAGPLARFLDRFHEDDP
jgi:hypothetical protein